MIETIINLLSSSWWARYVRNHGRGGESLKGTKSLSDTVGYCEMLAMHQLMRSGLGTYQRRFCCMHSTLKLVHLFVQSWSSKDCHRSPSNSHISVCLAVFRSGNNLSAWQRQCVMCQYHTSCTMTHTISSKTYILTTFGYMYNFAAWPSSHLNVCQSAHGIHAPCGSSHVRKIGTTLSWPYCTVGSRCMGTFGADSGCSPLKSLLILDTIWVHPWTCDYLLMPFLNSRLDNL